jgi:hypothetical protein
MLHQQPALRRLLSFRVSANKKGGPKAALIV